MPSGPGKQCHSCAGMQRHRAPRLHRTWHGLRAVCTVDRGHFQCTILMCQATPARAPQGKQFVYCSGQLHQHEGAVLLFPGFEVPEEFAAAHILHDKVYGGLVLEPPQEVDKTGVVHHPQHIPLCPQVDNLHYQDKLSGQRQYCQSASSSASLLYYINTRFLIRQICLH